ncbi:MAG: chemotaxis protein CheA [Burkholderiaceae bacterium]|nr:chemotaxis protein CheA [Burkholderiaceae bacterium]
MTPLLQQFVAESRDFLQDISARLMQLEAEPDNSALMGELFRLVHTLKGNCGLFDFPEMARVLHAGEDLMMAVRDGRLRYSMGLADGLLDAMDFVGMLLDEIVAHGASQAGHAAESAELSAMLRALIPAAAGAPTQAAARSVLAAAPLSLPKAASRACARLATPGQPLHWIRYTPEPECYFKGEDPFHHVRQVPQMLWYGVSASAPWPPLTELDPYRSVLAFELVSAAPAEELAQHFRYVPEQVALTPFVSPTEVEAPSAACLAALAAQRDILALPDDVKWLPGRLQAVAATLRACLSACGQPQRLDGLDGALAAALAQGAAAPLGAWLEPVLAALQGPLDATAAPATETAATTAAATAAKPVDNEPKFGRRQEDSAGNSHTLKVDQEKIDRMMGLIGEMVVAKNGLPYLAVRAEQTYGSADLAREIKAQYAVINRIAEEMQDAIMQVRMMPVSVVFQRFPRLVRDISRKLGKEVNLVLEGGETEADKNIIEALADPLIHILRNSLDHGIELPDQRLAAGKPAEGLLLLRASQEADRVVILIADDGKGIAPEVIKRKAIEQGLIDAETAARMPDQEAINLVFSAGLSSAETVSDLSGRGVGMDVVRNAVEQVNGTVALESVPGKGTQLRLSLPLSMAVSNVIVIESGGQLFGVPMDIVVETVRVPATALRTFKDREAVVLRDRVVPLRRLNDLLAVPAPQRLNDDGEHAILVIRVHGAPLGIVVDQFREVADIILKPLSGIVAGIAGYAGTALLGDGTVLMILHPKDLL